MSRLVSNQFVSMCPICNLKTVQTVQPRLKPIRSEEFWNRIQFDLVDMRHNPCTKNGKEFKWIAHVEDHFSKFHVLWAMEHKTAEEVTYGFNRHVLPYFGLPKILHCDNGTEFKSNRTGKNLYHSPCIT